MESKKTNRANLENKRFIFLEAGMIISLALALMAFEWKSYENSVATLPEVRWENVTELLPLNTQQHKLPPPPKAMKPVYKIVIVEKPVEIPDDFSGIDAGIDGIWIIPEKIAMPEEIGNDADDSIYNTSSVEIMPEFPGGEAALYKFLGDNIKYPRLAIESNIQGTVYISFVVEKDGSLSNITVERTPALVLSDESSRVVSIMPDWKPGKQGGRAVRVNFVLPVKFKLQ